MLIVIYDKKQQIVYNIAMVAKLLIHNWKGMNMTEIESKIQAQLTVIEQIYDIEIQNRDEIISLAAENIDDPRQVLMICT